MEYDPSEKRTDYQWQYRCIDSFVRLNVELAREHPELANLYFEEDCWVVILKNGEWKQFEFFSLAMAYVQNLERPF